MNQLKRNLIVAEIHYLESELDSIKKFHAMIDESNKDREKRIEDEINKLKLQLQELN